MHTWKLSPQNAHVAKFVECYWLLKKEPDDVGYAHPKLYPDPTAHLILAEAEQRYQYRQGTNVEEGRGSHWIHPHCKTFVMDHSNPFQIFGIKFHVDALYSLHTLFPQTVLDTISNIDVANVFKSQSFSLSDLQISGLKAPEEACAIMDETLLPILSDCHEDKHARLVSTVLPLLTDTPISQIGAAVHCAQRTVERSFLRVTKLTLKQYQTMTKLETMLDHISRLEGSQLNWADIAAEYGFSDQPHLIRYLKRSIGATPGSYIKQRDLTIDVYGDFE